MGGRKILHPLSVRRSESEKGGGRQGAGGGGKGAGGERPNPCPPPPIWLGQRLLTVNVGKWLGLREADVML